MGLPLVAKASLRLKQSKELTPLHVHLLRDPIVRLPRSLFPRCKMQLYTSNMNSREIIAKLEGNGGYKVAQKGSHVQFKHPTKPGRVTVPYCNRDIPLGTLRSIEKQAGLKLR